MDLSSYEPPNIEPVVTSFKTFEYIPISRHLKAEVLSGPYRENGKVTVREYTFVFLNVESVQMNVVADPWLSLLHMRSKNVGYVSLEFEEGIMEIKANKFIAKHTGTIPHANSRHW